MVKNLIAHGGCCVEKLSNGRFCLQGDWKGNVRVELSVMSLQNTSELHAFASSLPEWTTVSRFTSFKTAFTF